VNDFKVKAAIRLLQAKADETSRDTFDQRVSKLQQKFPSRVDSFEAAKPIAVSKFTDDEIFTAIKKMSRQAATAVDAWTKDLFTAMINVDREILSLLSGALNFILMSHGPAEDEGGRPFSNAIMDVIRAGRLIGIPKGENDIRPIVISSSLAKLLGMVVLSKCTSKCSRHQYAITTVRGAERITHLARQAFDNGKVIYRIDSKNAFNIASRTRILDVVTRLGEKDPHLLQYFMTMYQPTSHLFVYGEHNAMQCVLAPEGVRQGDAVSSFYFCLLMDVVCCQLATEFDSKDTDIWAFMDDLTIAAPPQVAESVLKRALEIMRHYGFEPNLDKSAMICRQDLPEHGPIVPIRSATGEFVMLGANITRHFDEFNAKMRTKIEKFFDMIDSLQLHPEAIHKILHFCGDPRLLYYASTTPPQFSGDVVRFFNERACSSFAKLVDLHLPDIDRDLLHRKDGAAIPDYVSNAQRLYQASLAMTIMHAKPEQVGLFKPPLHPTGSADAAATTGDSLGTTEADYDANWTHWTFTSNHVKLSPAEFRIALAARVNCIPRFAYDGQAVRCDCGELCETSRSIIAHTSRCFRLSRITEAVRHSMVKYAIVYTARAYGIGSTVEPNYYFYPDTIIRHRPDTTFYTGDKSIAIDVTVVSPDVNGPTGSAARRAAEQKVKDHGKAVALANHLFYPVAIETTGHIDSACFKFFTQLAAAVPKRHQRSLFQDLRVTISSTIATYRAHAIRNATFPQFTSLCV
jgi:hypothetical protein